MSEIIVLLPDPEGPTSAIDFPAGATTLMFFRTGTPGVYSNPTFRNSMPPAMSGVVVFAESASSSRVSLKISRIRSRPANASESWVPIETICTTGPMTSAR